MPNPLVPQPYLLFIGMLIVAGLVVLRSSTADGAVILAAAATALAQITVGHRSSDDH